jgi:PAS domain S-box-containing protein
MHASNIAEVALADAAALLSRESEVRQTNGSVGAELRDSERRFSEMIDALPAAIYTTDAQGRLTHFNPACVEFSGRTPILGSDQWCVSWKLYHADGTPMPHDECPMAIALKEGRILRGVEAIIERPDGTRRWFIPYPTALRDSEGKVVGGINMLVDITERKQAEAIRASLGVIVECSEDAIISKNLGGIITSWNKGAERLFGYTAEEAVGKPVTLLIPADRHQEESRILERLRRGERVEPFETVRIRKDGSLVEISLSISPLKDSSGRITGASKIARNITERKRTEQQLTRAQAQLADRAMQLEALVAERTARLQETIGELEHFSYTITHDMRAPLRAMQGFCGMLQEEATNRLTPESADHLRRVINASQRMDALIRDSLQYARVIRERIPLASVEPASVLRGILESYPNLQSPQVHIQIIEPLPAVIANETGLGQCFANLLSNAVKFVKPGTLPQVRIWAEIRPNSFSNLGGEAQGEAGPAPRSTLHAPNDATVRLWFEDNGIGIPQEYHERVFSMFQQLDKSYEGTGIGLALVRKTAQRMDGEAGVESEPGKGSRFWLEFRKASVNPSNQ